MGRSAWTVLAQAISSAGSFLFVSALARGGSLELSVVVLTALAVYSLVASTAGWTVGQLVYLRRDSYRFSLVQPDLARISIWLACATAVSMAAVSAAGGVGLTWAAVLGLVGLSSSMWAQARFLAFGNGRPKQAALGDLIWTVPMIPAWLLEWDGYTVVFLYSIAPVVSLVATGTGRTYVDSIGQRAKLSVLDKRQAAALFVEAFVGTGTLQVFLLLLGLLAGSESLAGLRVALGVVGPVAVLSTGIALWFGPLVSRLEESGDMAKARLIAVGILGAAGLLSVAGLVLIVLGGFEVFGRFFLGEIWPLARPFVPWVVLLIGVRTASVGPQTIMKSVGFAGSLAKVRSLESVTTLLLCPVLVVVSGTESAVISLVLVRSMIMVYVFFYALRVSVRK